MQVAVGRTVPKGFLPVFSVTTEEEANILVVAACHLGHDGKYYADELMHEQNFENLDRFSDKLARIHDVLKQRGKCQCDSD